jgi:N,N'-diacetyllegionaminate synthase
MYGPDAALGLEPYELEELVDGVREIAAILAAPVDKDAAAGGLVEMKRIFEKSVVAVTDIPAGATLQREMLGAKKPGTGIPARRLPELVGRRAAAHIAADTVLTEAHVE